MDIKIRQEKIDYLKIIKMVFKQKDWGKTYTMYTSANVTISCILTEFNFEDSTAWFRLKCEYYDKDGDKRSQKTFIRYVTNHFKPEDFAMHLNKKLISLIKDIYKGGENEEAEAKFRDLRYWPFDTKEADIIAAGFTLELEQIQAFPNEELKQDCLSVLKDKANTILNANFRNQVAYYIKRNPWYNEDLKRMLDKLEAEE